MPRRVALTSGRSTFTLLRAVDRIRVDGTRSSFAVGLLTMSESRERIEVARSGERLRTRTFTDDLGQTWLVSEQPYSEYDRRSGRSLIFSNELAVRRVRDYPSDWYTLSERALAALSWRA